MEDFVKTGIRIIVIFFALTIHEFAHGFVAHLRGDNTAKDAGRLTLNPLAHLDILGAIMLLFGPIGWAKPVPINPYNFKEPKTDIFLVSIAGVSANLIMAFLVAMIIRYFGVSNLQAGAQIVLFTIVYINVGLGIFNLIPIPPLDGSKVLASFLPDEAASRFERMNPLIGFIFLMFIIFTPGVANIVLGLPMNLVLRLMLGPEVPF